MQSICSQRIRFSLLILIVSNLFREASAAEWRGFDQQAFLIDGRNAFVVVPATPLANRPWVWRAEFFDHEPQADLELLRHGFHLAYIDLRNLYGSPVSMRAMDQMYKHVIKEFGLSSKVVLEGFSRGGLFTLNWAAKHPERVACIYNDAPVCDFRSWPAGSGKSKPSAMDWEQLKAAHGFADDQEAFASKQNPIENLAPLAKAKIPLLHVCGETDDVVPIEENTRVVEKLYSELGGKIVVIAKPNCNHHPHSLRDPTRIVNFVLSHTGYGDRVRVPLTPYGHDYFTLRDGLDRCRRQFEQKKKGRVAFLGGSITQTPGWRDQACEQLKTRFPDTEFDFINAGISSLGSTPGAFRFVRDVLARGSVDLLFEEAAVNDDTNGFSDVEQVRGMEGIVRQARLVNPNIDIVLLHFVDPGKMEEIRSGRTPSVIQNHEKVAERYRLPSIDLAREVTDRIHAGEFTWKKDFVDLHPSPFGHTLYAKSIERLLDAAWKPGSSVAMKVDVPALPEPIDRFSYFHGRLVSPKDALESGKLKLQNGWKLEPNWEPSDKAATRPGFVRVPTLVGDEVGSTFQFQFHGTAVGLFVTSGPDTGNIEYRIDGGPWRTMDLFTRWSHGLHLPWAKILAPDLHEGDHQLELRIASSADARSSGHAVRIVHLLVN